MGVRLVVLAGGLAGLFLVFGVIEKLWPSVKGQKRFRRGWKTDIAWFFWNATVSRPITAFGVGAAAVLVAVLFFRVDATGTAIRAFVERETWVSGQPMWFQVVSLLVLFDLLGYWCHRWFHRRTWLWKYHSVHHSSEELDWLSAVRVHPVNELLQRAVQVLPLFALGYQPGLLGGFTVLFTVLAIGFHANVGWDWGPLRYVISSPRFHRWHHTSEEEGLDRNFAGLFPWLDLLFGTFHMPREREPQEFGIVAARVPTGLWSQLMWPWRRA